MEILETLDQAKAYLQKIKKKYQFRKARLAREEAAELQSSLAKCNGQLTLCKSDFNTIIKQQCKNIKKGKEQGADTVIQEQILWDSAIGYMLVRDAIFTLQSINSYDSVAHAYDMLDVAVKLMSGKKKSVNQFTKIVPSRERNAYGYITSATAAQKKEELLNTFFEQLKETADIEACLELALNPNGASDEDTAESDDSSAEAAYRRMKKESTRQVTEEDFSAGLSGMTDIHVSSSTEGD